MTATGFSASFKVSADIFNVPSLFVSIDVMMPSADAMSCKIPFRLIPSCIQEPDIKSQVSSIYRIMITDIEDLVKHSRTRCCLLNNIIASNNITTVITYDIIFEAYSIG